MINKHLPGRHDQKLHSVNQSGADAFCRIADRKYGLDVRTGVMTNGISFLSIDKIDMSHGPADIKTGLNAAETMCRDNGIDYMVSDSTKLSPGPATYLDMNVVAIKHAGVNSTITAAVLLVDSVMHYLNGKYNFGPVNNAFCQEFAKNAARMIDDPRSYLPVAALFSVKHPKHPQLDLFTEYLSQSSDYTLLYAKDLTKTGPKPPLNDFFQQFN